MDGPSIYFKIGSVIVLAGALAALIWQVVVYFKQYSPAPQESQVNKADHIDVRI